MSARSTPYTYVPGSKTDARSSVSSSFAVGAPLAHPRADPNLRHAKDVFNAVVAKTAAEPRAGSVYIFSNPDMPGVVAVGSTPGSVEAALQEANAFDPWRPCAPYRVEAAVASADADETAAVVFRALASACDPPCSYFLRVSVDVARRALMRAVKGKPVVTDVTLDRALDADRGVPLRHEIVVGDAYDVWYGTYHIERSSHRNVERDGAAMALGAFARNHLKAFAESTGADLAAVRRLTAAARPCETCEHGRWAAHAVV